MTKKMAPETERGVVFDRHQVQLILSGAKTQMRMTIETQPKVVGRYSDGSDMYEWRHHRLPGGTHQTKLEQCRENMRTCSPHTPGCIIWVKEPFVASESGIIYRADLDDAQNNQMIQKGISIPSAATMKREQSRLTLKVTEVRSQNLQEISDDDVIAEGFASRREFADHWDKTHKFLAQQWNYNQFIWAITFKVHGREETA